MTPKSADHLMLPVLGALSAGIVAFLIAGIVGWHWAEVILPVLGGAAGHAINTI